MSSKLNTTKLPTQSVLSLSKLSNINIKNCDISLKNIINNEKNKKKILIKNEIIENKKEKAKKKKQIYKNIYKICIMNIQLKYKLTDKITFIIPLTFISELYDWIECKEYLILKLKKNNFNIDNKNNVLLISWESFN